VSDFRAIKAVCDAVLGVLRSNCFPEDFNTTELVFNVFLAPNFKTGMDAGVSLFMYRVLVNGTHRTPSPKPMPDGRRFLTQLPLDLHFILTAWGKDYSMTHSITGWMMRVMEDNPVIPSGFLQNIAPGVFKENETVEISSAEFSTEDLLRLWEVTAQNNYQLSVPYVARNIRIDSTRPVISGTVIQEREFGFKGHESQ